MKKLTKTACFTDIHFGAKTNSDQHNQDCLNYIDWFCDNVVRDPSIDSVMFLGDWFENRTALNVATMYYSYQAAKKLNNLHLPIYFIIGNHDLFHRHTREVYSTVNFHEFSNFTIINEPTVIKTVGDGILMCPFLFPEEYPTLLQYRNLTTWWGHFEFKGFVVTGHSMKMPTGPDPVDFSGPTHIFSGHFHKRQQENNITYIGNVFPTNFGDAGDTKRGMMIYDHITQTTTFKDWDQCPKYIKTCFSNILDGNVTIDKSANVKCVMDIPISFEESSTIKQEFFQKYMLREFVLEETQELTTALEDTQTTLNAENSKLDSVDELVIQMLQEIKSDHINNTSLIEIYKGIPND